MASRTAKVSPTATVSPGFTAYGNDNRRCWRVYHATVIPIDGMGNAVHFDTISQSLNRGDNVEAPSERSEPIFELTQAVDVDIDAGSIHFDTVAVKVEATDLERVGMPAMEQLHGPTHFTPNLRAPTHRRRMELDLLNRQIGNVGFNRCLHQGHIGVLRGQVCHRRLPCDRAIRYRRLLAESRDSSAIPEEMPCCWLLP